MVDDSNEKLLQDLYLEVSEIVSEADTLHATGKAAVLFRAALVVAEEEVGILSAIHLMSHLLASTLSVVAETTPFRSFDEVLREWDQSTEKPN